MSSRRSEKGNQPRKPRERSLPSRFLVGAFFGLLAGWIAAQFTRIGSAWDLVAHLGGFAFVFGIGAMVFPEEKFLKFISRLY